MACIGFTATRDSIEDLSLSPLFILVTRVEYQKVFELLRVQLDRHHLYVEIDLTA